MNPVTTIIANTIAITLHTTRR